MDIELERLDRLGGSKRRSVRSLGKDEEAQGLGSGSGKESSRATSNYSRVEVEEALSAEVSETKTLHSHRTSMEACFESSESHGGSLGEEVALIEAPEAETEPTWARTGLVPEHEKTLMKSRPEVYEPYWIDMAQAIEDMGIQRGAPIG